jgi:hypothetical protein
MSSLDLAPAAAPRVRLDGRLRRVGCAGRVLPREPLAAQEGPDAGHTIARHANSLAEDRARLQREPWLGASGSFLDRRTMERAVARALDAEACDILEWRGSAGSREPFIREVMFDRPVGRNLTREDLAAGRGPRECAGVRVVLFPDPGRPTGYHVRTAYPVEAPPSPVVLPHSRLADYEAAGAGHTLARAVGAGDLMSQLRAAPGRRSAARFTDAATAETAVAAAIAAWSGEIAAWLARGTEPALVRAYCGRTIVGSTLQRAELDAGEGSPMPTPALLLRLRRDPRFAEGFAVEDATPVRGF